MLSHVFFSIAFLKPVYRVLSAESWDGDTQLLSAATASAALSTSSEFIIYNGKQGGVATVHGKGHDIVTGGT
jgi:hypothetical protein